MRRRRKNFGEEKKTFSICNAFGVCFQTLNLHRNIPVLEDLQGDEAGTFPFERDEVGGPPNANRSAGMCREGEEEESQEDDGRERRREGSSRHFGRRRFGS